MKNNIKKIWILMVLLILIEILICFNFINKNLDTNLYLRIFETINLISFSGIFILTLLLERNARNIIIEFYGLSFLSIAILQFIYLLMIDNKNIYLSIYFIENYINFMTVFLLLFPLLYFKKDQTERRVKVNNILLINILLLCFGIIGIISTNGISKTNKIDNIIINQSVFIYMKFSVLLMIILLFVLLSRNLYIRFSFKRNIYIFIILFSISLIFYQLSFEKLDILFINSKILKTISYIYIFYTIYINFAVEHYKNLKKLAVFSEEILSEKLNFQKSFSILTEFIYDNLSYIFDNIAFYYNINENLYELIAYKSIDENDIPLEKVLEIDLDKISKYKEIEVIQSYELPIIIQNNNTNQNALKIYSDKYLIAKIEKDDELLGLLLCKTNIKKLKLSKDIIENITIFKNFSKALIMQIERIEKIKNLSSVDPLTGLYNRRYFLKELVQESLNYERTALKFCIAYFDMDNLKPLNDIYGHAIGDKAIKIIANVLKRSIRKVDIPARFGGDEFAILFKSCSYEGIKNRIEKIIDEIEEISSRELPEKIYVSCGIAIYPDDSNNLDELMKIADNRMYEEKLKHKIERGEENNDKK
ncbi:GGDEF domain-containing protein [Caldicellulosiruptoraceae bacterium PP1]